MRTQFASFRDEAARLAALDELDILDTAPEQEYDDLTALASLLCQMPIALLTVVGADRQFFKSAKNFACRETPRAQSFCAHTIKDASTLVVRDALADPRFASNPAVTGEPGIRFYAGAPILSANGHVVGALCVIDQRPNTLAAEQLEALEALARQASALMQARVTARNLRRFEAETEAATRAVRSAQRTLQGAIDAAELATWFYDPARGVAGGDERLRRMFAVPVTEGPMSLWMSAVVEEDRSRVGEALGESLSGAPYDLTYRVLVHGEVRSYRARGKVAPSLDGVMRLVGVCEDVTLTPGQKAA